MCSVPMPVLLLLLMWARVSLAGPQCERSSAVRVSVSTWTNQTGHRLLAAEMRSDDSLKDAVSLSVDQWTERCGAASTVALSVTASSPVSNSTATIPVPATLVPIKLITTTPVVSTTAPPDTIRPTPRPDYHHLPGHGYYKKYRNDATWEEGRRICESEGAHLAVLESREEFDAVYDFSGCCPWIGVYRQDNSSSWITVLGQPLGTPGFMPWVTLESKFKDNDNCVLFNKGSNIKRGISGYACTTNNWSFLCEQDE